MDYLQRLSETYHDYQTRIIHEDDHILFVIKNTTWDEDISIGIYDDELGEELIFNFCKNHEHFHNIEKLIASIDGFLRGEKIAYRFLRDGKEVSRGLRLLDSFDISTNASIIDSLIETKSYWEEYGAWGETTYKTLLLDYLGESGQGSFHLSIFAWDSQQHQQVNFDL